MNVKNIWNNFLDNIKVELNPLAFETWFQDTSLYEYKDGICKIIVPMSIYKKHLTNKYYSLIVNTLNEILGEEVEIEFYTEDEIGEPVIENIDVKKDIINNKVDDIKYIHFSNLNKNLTFDNYIEGNTNKFAREAALNVAHDPGRLYNPLFIYGNSGIGKTHLMNAIGNYIEENTNLKVLYVSSDEFITDFRKMYNKDDNNIDKVVNFKEKYSNLDVLIVDDIQFFQTAPKSQDEFFKIFDELYRNNKQIIISSDRAADDLIKLEDRLRTRFCWGLTADIFPPDFELRVNIIKKKIIGESIKKNIPDDVIEYIASNVGNNVRNLEGSITRLLAYSSMMGNLDINLDLAIDVLKDYVNKGYSEKNSINRIQRIVAEYFQVSVDDMKSKKRSANLTLPRQIAMYLCRTITNESFPKIGIDFGGKDHSTVMHSVEKIENEIKTNKEMAAIIEKLKKEIV